MLDESSPYGSNELRKSVGDYAFWECQNYFIKKKKKSTERVLAFCENLKRLLRNWKVSRNSPGDFGLGT